MPSAIVATGVRVTDMIVRFSSQPASSLPIRWSSGTNTSSKSSSAAGQARCPILSKTWPTAKPGESVGTAKQLMDSRIGASGSCDANTVTRLASEPLEMKTLRPLIR
jgi:hypothetical protein